MKRYYHRSSADCVRRSPRLWLVSGCPNPEGFLAARSGGLFLFTMQLSLRLRPATAAVARYARGCGGRAECKVVLGKFRRHHVGIGFPYDRRICSATTARCADGVAVASLDGNEGHRHARRHAMHLHLWGSHLTRQTFCCSASSNLRAQRAFRNALSAATPVRTSRGISQ